MPRIRRELAREWSQNLDEYDEDRKCPYTSNEVWPRMVNWYKYGYARAKRRYRGDDDIAYLLYKNVGETMSEYWPELENYCDTGRKFTMVLDLDNGDVTLRGLDD